MEDFSFELTKKDNSLIVLLGKELSTANGNVLTEELTKYQGQDIEKIIFNTSCLTLLTSSGIRAIIYAHRQLGSNPEIVFVNCAKEIREVLNHVGIAKFFKFEESQKMRKECCLKILGELDPEDVNRAIQERKEDLAKFEAHNDVVCYSMKMGQDEE